MTFKNECDKCGYIAGPEEGIHIFPNGYADTNYNYLCSDCIDTIEYEKNPNRCDRDCKRKAVHYLEDIYSGSKTQLCNECLESDERQYRLGRTMG